MFLFSSIDINIYFNGRQCKKFVRFPKQVFRNRKEFLDSNISVRPELENLKEHGISSKKRNNVIGVRVRVETCQEGKPEEECTLQLYGIIMYCSPESNHYVF